MTANLGHAGLPGPARHTDRQTVALCMIVKNEAKVIERCLASARPFIDTWVICDTGSTDGTPELILEVLGDIPGKLLHRPWRDFGVNRTEALAAARGVADYLLLLDADMEVRAGADFMAEPLTADAYMVRTEGSLDYAVARLIRSDRPWRYQGPTHEYLACDEPFHQQVTDRLTVVHHADGGSREVKFLRDVVLLEQHLRDHPGDPRSTFYLAQTYRDLGLRDKAIALYEQRVEQGGWPEEVFYAAYQAALLRAEIDFPAALSALFAAWGLRPSRAEPLYDIARLAREAGWHQLAHMAASRGLEIPYPDDVLFVRRWVWTWGLRLEHAVATAWLGNHEEAVRLNDEMSADPTVPDHVLWTVRHNRGFSASRLSGRGIEVPPPSRITNPTFVASRPPLLAELIDGVDVVPIPFTTDRWWHPLNPSIAADGEGFRAIVRTVNYEKYDGGYAIHEGTSTCTVNHFATFDRQLRLSGRSRIIDPDAPPKSTLVLGFEDCRLFRFGGDWWATATTRQSRWDAVCEIALLRFDGDRVAEVRVLEGPDRNRHEKNWMPFIHAGALHILYGFAPFVVYRWVPDAGRLEEVSRVETPAATVHFRGGSQGVAVPGGYLFVVHESKLTLGLQVYDHRLVLVDHDLQPVAASGLFTFTHDNIEYCAGAARRDGDLVMSIGIEDRQAALVTAPLEGLLGLLRPLAEVVAAEAVRQPTTGGAGGPEADDDTPRPVDG